MERRQFDKTIWSSPPATRYAPAEEVAVSDPCDACGGATSDALARTVRLTVDRSQIDAQRLCPECFADWIERYEAEMSQADAAGDGAGEGDGDGDSDIIVD
jgi:hypothetical protein